MNGLLGKHGDAVISTYAPGANGPANMPSGLALFASAVSYAAVQFVDYANLISLLPDMYTLD